MIKTTFNDVEVFIITAPWDGNASFDAEFALTVDRQSSLTNREARRPYTATVLGTIRYQATVQDADLRQLQGSLRALNTQPVILPFWPAAGRWADRAGAKISGGLLVAYKADWSQYEIYTADDEPVWPAADDFIAPCLMGFLAKNQPAFLAPGAATWPVEFTESSPAAYALTFNPDAFTNAPALTDTTVYKVLPVVPDFSRVTEELRISVQRDQIGFTREQSTTFYPQAIARAQSATYTLHGSEIATLLGFFSTIAGPGKPFFAAAWLNVATLTADIGAADTVLHVEDTVAVAVGDFLAFLGADALLGRKVTDVTANTITLASALGIAFAADGTCIFPFCLVRMDEPKLKLSWISGDTATCQLPFTEVPAEYVLAADETRSVTQGALPKRVILFEFTRDFGNGTVSTWRFTNWETDITYGGHTWASSNYEHGEIPQSLNLEEDSVDLASFVAEGNPLVDDVTLRSEGPLLVAILHADYDGAALSNVETKFFGEVTKPGLTGSKLKASAAAGPVQLDVQVPRMVHGTMCNHVNGANIDGTFLISFGCTLLRSDWHFTATVATPIASGYPYTLNLAGLARTTGAAPTFFADWFALGYIEWGSGANIQRRYIVKSTTPVAGAMAIKLHRWFDGDGPAAGDAVALYPGCDGTKQTCRAYNAGTNPTGKFDNYVNFGGEAETPAGNPSLLKLSSSATAGGKK